MPTVTVEDLNEVQKKEQIPGFAKKERKTRIAEEIKKGQAYSPLLTVLLVAVVSQFMGIDLAHLAGAYLIVRGIPPVFVSLKQR